MVLADSDIKIYLSGGASNTDPNLSLGGARSNTELVDGTVTADGGLNNLFDPVTEAEALGGDQEYRCFYIKNTSTTDKLKNASVFLNSGTTNPKTSIHFTIGGAGIGGTEQTITNENTTPAGLDPFQQIFSRPTTPNIGDLNPGQHIGIWVRWDVAVGTDQDPNDQTVLVVIGDREQGTTPGGGGGGGPVIPPPTNTDYLMAVAGDFDCEDATDKNIDMIIDKNPDDLLFLGDSSYDDDSASCFINNLKRLTNIYPRNIHITLGNHDDEEDASEEVKNDLVNTFGIPKEGYHAFVKENIKVIVAYNTTEASYGNTSAQYKFIENELKKGESDPAVIWMIVSYHKPTLVSDNDNHSSLIDFRDLYQPLFDKYKVDLVFSGHNHLFHRSFPVKHNVSSPTNPTIINSTQGPYTDVDGRIYVTVGTAGHKLDEFTGSQESWVAYRNDEVFGTLFLQLSNNGKTLTCTFRDLNGASKHSWVMTKNQ